MVAVVGIGTVLSIRDRLVRRFAATTIVMTALLVAPVQPAFASDQTGTVNKVAFAGGRFLFWMTGARIGTRPSCDCCSRWELTVSDANSQARMSLILTAFAQGKTVYISGANTCVADTEGLAYFDVS